MTTVLDASMSRGKVSTRTTR